MKMLKSIAFAWQGVKTCFKDERNFKAHILVTTMAIILGIVLHISNTEWTIVFLCIAFVLVTELINTAIENLCDFVQADFNLVIKKIKDISAGAVLVASICSLIVGGFIFLPKIIYLLNHIK